MRLSQPRREQGFDPRADERITVVAEEFLDLGVGHDDPAVVVTDENPVGSKFDDHTGERLCASVRGGRSFR